MIKLSDFKIKLQQGERKVIQDSNGLILQIVGGTKGTSYYFQHRCTFNGKRIVFTIKTNDLKEARKIAFKRNTKVQEGRQPDDVSTSELTFRQCIQEYIDHKAPSYAPNTLRKLELIANKHLFPHGDELMVNLSANKLNQLIFKPLVENSTLSTISYLYSTIKNIFVLASVKHEGEPLKDIKGLSLLLPHEQCEHLPSMTEGDTKENIQSIYNIVKLSSNLVLHFLFKLSLHLLLRPSEVCAIKIENIDFENSILFIEKTKTLKDGFRVPLTSQSLQIIYNLKALKRYSNNPYLFENRTNINDHINRETLSKHFYRNGLKDIQTAHGLRAIGRTWFEKQDFKFEVKEACLSHFTGSSTVKAYKRTDYLEERKKVMKIWSNFLETCF